MNKKTFPIRSEYTSKLLVNICQKINMNTSNPLAELLADRLKNTTQQKPITWTALMKEFVENGDFTESELVRAMNSLVMPSGNISGNDQGFWVGRPL